MSETEHFMYRFAVAAAAVASDYGDTRVRGYLTEHPDHVSARLDEIDSFVKAVRQAVDRERAEGKWGGLVAEPAGAALSELIEHAVEFETHTCDCPFCLRGGRDSDRVVLDELDRIEALPTVQADNGRANTFAVGVRWTARMIREAIERGAPAEPIGVTVSPPPLRRLP
ncbi:hypothetical protein ACFXCU_30780 [Streptomyces virginiae]|uniref:hypothetical protein n=1 Tax=Streptomyces virginiae TaxID=1961 RepID=UPI00367AAC98